MKFEGVAIANQMGRCPNQTGFPGTASMRGIEFLATTENLTRLTTQNCADVQDGNRLRTSDVHMLRKGLRDVKPWDNAGGFFFLPKRRQSRKKSNL